jgi:uncharacterized protein (TIGR03066 family)
MRYLGVLVVFTVFALTAYSQKADRDAPKTNEEKILGKWELTRADSPKPTPFFLEFKKEGKMIITATPGSEPISNSGTYKIEGDKIIYGNGKKQTFKIKKLTATQLVIEDDGGKSDEFKKK